MRVLMLAHGLDMGGGIETFLLNFLRALDRRDVQIDVCCTSGRSGTLTAEVEALGVGVWCCRQGRNPLDFKRRFRSELADRDTYDIVHGHTGHYSGPALSVARRVGVPRRVAHYHNTVAGHKNDWSRRLYDRWMRRLVLTCATDIVGCSWAALSAHFPGKSKDDPRMGVIRYGIPVESFQQPTCRDEVRRELGIATDAAVIGHIGSFRPQKNHARLIEAARQVVDQCPKAHFLLIGDGPLRPKITQQIEQTGLAAQVTLAGLRSDVPRLLGAMDLLALPSVSEGLPLVLIEAQCAGVPVFASAIPPAREAVAPVFHKYLRNPYDVSGLAEGMLLLLDDAGHDRALSEQARAFGSRFTMETSVQAMLATWRMPGVKRPDDPGAAPTHDSQ